MPTVGKKDVGFCNVRMLHTEEGEGHAVLLESVRVSEGTRGCGYVTIIIEEVMCAVKSFVILLEQSVFCQQLFQKIVRCGRSLKKRDGLAAESRRYGQTFIRSYNCEKLM